MHRIVQGVGGVLVRLVSKQQGYPVVVFAFCLENFYFFYFFFPYYFFFNLFIFPFLPLAPSPAPTKLSGRQFLGNTSCSVVS